MQHSVENEPGARSVAGEFQQVFHAIGAPETFQEVVSCLVFVALGVVGYISGSLLLRRKTKAKVAKIASVLDDAKPALSIEGSSSKVRLALPATKDAAERMHQLRRSRRSTLGGLYASLKQEAFAVRQLVPLILSRACLSTAQSLGSTRCWQEDCEVSEAEKKTCEETPEKKPVKDPRCVHSESRQSRPKKKSQEAPTRDCRPAPESQNAFKPALRAMSLSTNGNTEKLATPRAGKGKPTKTQLPQARSMVVVKTALVERPREEDHAEKNNAFEICAMRELELRGQSPKTQEQPVENSLPFCSAAPPQADEDVAEQECAVTDDVPESEEISAQCDVADCEEPEQHSADETDETGEPACGEGSSQHSADETSESGQEILCSMNEVPAETACHTASCAEVTNAVQQRVICEFESRFRDGPVESLLTGNDNMTSRSWPSCPSAFPECCEPSDQYKAAFGLYYPDEVQGELLRAQGDFPPGVFHQPDQFNPAQFVCPDASEWFGDSFCPDESVDDYTAEFLQQWGVPFVGRDYDFQSVDFSEEDQLHDWTNFSNQSGFCEYFAWHAQQLHGDWMQETQSCEQSGDYLAPAALDVCDDERHDPPPEVVSTGRTENEFIGLQLVAELGEWCAMKEQCEGGRPFFWNRSTGLRTWKMPQIMEDMGIGDHLMKYSQKVQPPSDDMSNHERQVRASRLTLGLDSKRGKEMSMRLQAMHLAMSYASQQRRPEFVARLRAKGDTGADDSKQAQGALVASLLHRRCKQKSVLGEEPHSRSRQARRGRRGDTKLPTKDELPQRVPSPAPPPLVSDDAFPALVGAGLAPWVSKAAPQGLAPEE